MLFPQSPPRGREAGESITPSAISAATRALTLAYPGLLEGLPFVDHIFSNLSDSGLLHSLMEANQAPGPSTKNRDVQDQKGDSVSLNFRSVSGTKQIRLLRTIGGRLCRDVNAWLVSVGITCWFCTEVVGEIFNIQIGLISSIMYNLVWVFYGTYIVCLALSGYRWNAT